MSHKKHNNIIKKIIIDETTSESDTSDSETPIKHKQKQKQKSTIEKRENLGVSKLSPPKSSTRTHSHSHSYSYSFDSDSDDIPSRSESESETETESESESSPTKTKSEKISTKTKSKKKKNNKLKLKNNIVINTNNELFQELIRKQLTDVPIEWKLSINDIKRICKYIYTSIFDRNICCIWNGYITNVNNTSKGTYVNFYFKNKKVALHRLLYSNFIAPLDSSEYLKFNCNNKGICCSVYHYEKYKYSKNKIEPVKKKKDKNHPHEKPQEIHIIENENSDDLMIEFD